jgi:hypothetical protein
MWWIHLSLIYRGRRQHLVEALLRDSLATHSPNTMVMTLLQKDLPSLAMQGRTNRDLPMGTILSMLVGSNPLSTLRAHGNRAQAGNGSTAILTTTSNSPMKKFQVATREGACPSLLVAIMISPWAIMSSRRSTPALTPG